MQFASTFHFLDYVLEAGRAVFGCISMQRKLDTRWGTSYNDVCNATEVCLRHHAQVVVPAHRSYKRAFGRDPHGFVHTCGEFMESAGTECNHRSLVEGRHTRFFYVDVIMVCT